MTIEQHYVFNEVQKLFGRDVVKNFVIMFTFCDGKRPPAEEAFTSDETFG